MSPGTNPNMDYSQIPGLMDRGKGFVIEAEDQLEESLYAAENIHSSELCILDIRLDIHDGSPALQRLTEVLGRKVQWERIIIITGSYPLIV
jgi:hypothetical protein